MKSKTYREKFQAYHKEEMFGRFLLWLEKKKSKGGKNKNG